jgi:hypothetical protein
VKLLTQTHSEESFKARDTENPEKESVHVIASRRWIGEGDFSLATAVDALLTREMDHPNVVKVTEFRLSRSPGLPDTLFLVKDMLDSDLRTVMSRQPREITVDHAQFFFYQLVYGLRSA